MTDFAARIHELEQQRREAAGSMNGQPTGDPYIVPMESIEMRSIEWLDEPLWQTSTFHLLSAPKGAGKGTYTALVAAKMSRGDYPCGARRVVWLAGEDSLAIDVKPRLVAAGADMARCSVWVQRFRLPDDVATLHRELVAAGDVGMLVIDPIASYIGKRNTNSDDEVRDAIEPLNRLADDLGILIVGVRNLGKDRTRGAALSIIGASAWADVPRAVLTIAPDDEDDTVRHVQAVLGNRSALSGGIAFRIEAVPVDGLTEPVTCAVELGASTKDVDDLLAPQKKPDSKSGKARDLILDMLEASPTLSMESDELDAAVARAAGVAAKTAQNQRTSLGKEGLIRFRPELDEHGHPTRWIVFRTAAARP